VADSIEALLGLAGSADAEGGVFNVGTQREISIADLARTVAQRVGSLSEPVFIPYDEAYEYGFEDMERRVPDTGRVNKLLGWTPHRSLEQIIDDVAADVQARINR
jgi:UDP-glucose 4-epimerase